MVELDHTFSTGKPADYNWDAVLDLDRIIPCVEGGKVIERESPDLAKAEIKVKMGAMSMTFRGTVEVAERDEDAHRAVLKVKSKDVGGQGYANADVAFTLADGGGSIHTAAQINGKAASMGEGVVYSVLDALINDFTSKLAKI
jgi:carbon monoxide dehydrogenase subunit G